MYIKNLAISCGYRHRVNRVIKPYHWNKHDTASVSEIRNSVVATETDISENQIM